MQEINSSVSPVWRDLSNCMSWPYRSVCVLSLLETSKLVRSGLASKTSFELTWIIDSARSEVSPLEVEEWATLALRCLDLAACFSVRWFIKNLDDLTIGWHRVLSTKIGRSENAVWFELLPTPCFLLVPSPILRSSVESKGLASFVKLPRMSLVGSGITGELEKPCPHYQNWKSVWRC